MKPANLLPTKKEFQFGQSLIEIIATIAIGTVLILALVALSVRANRSSDFSKAQSQASILASETLEIIRTIRKQNVVNGAIKKPFRFVTAAGTCDVTNNNTDLNSFDELYTINIDDQDTTSGCDPYGRIGHLHRPGVPDPGSGSPDSDCNLITDPWCLHFNTTTAGDQVVLNGRTFTRRIYVADTAKSASGQSDCNQNDGTNDWQRIKQFTAVVTWTDTSGTHTSVSTTCLNR